MLKTVEQLYAVYMVEALTLDVSPLRTLSSLPCERALRAQVPKGHDFRPVDPLGYGAWGPGNGM